MTRVAIVHDWLRELGGAEQVLLQLLAIWPEADVHCVFDRLPPAHRWVLRGRPTIQSPLGRLPGIGRYHRFMLPLMPLAIEQLDLDRYDLVISSSYAVAKGVLTRAGQTHVCYCHSPMRYAWDLYHESMASMPGLLGVRRTLARVMLHRLRQWDVVSAQRVDHFIANSATVAARIAKVWRRDSIVVHPPVDLTAFSPGTGPRGDFYLTLGRLVPYKRVDALVEAFARLPDRQLVVAGEGGELARLRRLAPSNVRFLGRVPPEEAVRLMRSCRAFLFAAEEDFGIAPVEAMACGAPVLTWHRGGGAESVLDGITGLHVTDRTPDGFAAAIRRFEAAPPPVPAACRARAEEFSQERFRTMMAKLVGGWLGDAR